MAGRRKKTDKTKASKQQRLIFMIKYLIDEWLTMEEIPFSWLVDIYKYEFGYGKDNEDTIEVAIKRDLILLLKQGFIEQKNKKMRFGWFDFIDDFGVSNILINKVKEIVAQLILCFNPLQSGQGL